MAPASRRCCAPSTAPTACSMARSCSGARPSSACRRGNVSSAAAGVTVLIVEQNVRGALLISDRALVMEQGRKFMEGPADEVRTDPRIRQAYLGGNIQQTAA